MNADDRAKVLADGATRNPTDTYALDLIAWAVADSHANDHMGLRRMLKALDGPTIYERMTGEPA